MTEPEWIEANARVNRQIAKRVTAAFIGITLGCALASFLFFMPSQSASAMGDIERGAADPSLTVVTSNDNGNTSYASSGTKVFTFQDANGLATVAEVVTIQKCSNAAVAFRIRVNGTDQAATGHTDFVLQEVGEFYVAPGRSRRVAIHASAGATYGTDFTISGFE